MSEDLEWLGDKDINALVKRFDAMLKAGMQYFFDVDEFEEVIEYYFEIHDFKMAQIAIEQALLQHPSGNAFKVHEARVLTYQKKYYEALELLNHLELLEPTNEDIYLSKGEIYSLINKHGLAIEEYKKAIPYSEQPEDVYANIAFEYENLNNYKGTIKYLKKALNYKPDSENLIHEIAFFFEITGREEDAVDFFGEFLDKNPYSKVAWFNLGIFYNTLELYEKAIEAYEFTLAIDETFSSAYFNIANSYSGLNKFKTAIDYYKETFKYEEPEATTYFYIGESYESLDDLENAMIYFNKALKLDDKLAEAWAAIGRLHVKDGKSKIALKYYAKAIKIMPLSDEFKYDQAVIYLKFSEFDKSEKLFLEIVDHDVNYIEAWINLSVCRLEAEGIETAIDTIEQALENNKEEASLWYRLAGYLYKSGKVQQAYFYIEAALKLDKDKFVELIEYLPELSSEPRFVELLGIYKDS